MWVPSNSECPVDLLTNQQAPTYLILHRVIISPQAFMSPWRRACFHNGKYWNHFCTAESKMSVKLWSYRSMQRLGLRVLRYKLCNAESADENQGGGYTFKPEGTSGNCIHTSNQCNFVPISLWLILSVGIQDVLITCFIILFFFVSPLDVLIGQLSSIF